MNKRNEYHAGLSPLNFPESLTLAEALKNFCIDYQSDIPFFVWLFENPQSPLNFPGKIDLFNHDCLHILLGLGVNLEDEAFVVGFSLGTDETLNPWLVNLFKVVSNVFYPQKFRFRKHDFYYLDWGIECATKHPLRNLHQIDFHNYLDMSIGEVRKLLGINPVIEYAQPLPVMTGQLAMIG